MVNSPPEINYAIATYLVDRLHDLGFHDISMLPLTVAHFEAASRLPVERRLKALRWACEVHVTVAEMMAWDRAVNGEDLTAS